MASRHARRSGLIMGSWSGEQRLAGGARRRDDLLRRLERVGERLLAEHLRAGRERLKRHGRVMLGIGAYRDRVRLQRLERLSEKLEARNFCEFPVEVMARRGVAGAKADELEAVYAFIGSCVAHPHRADPDDKYALPVRLVRMAGVAHRRLLLPQWSAS